ncbi:hypothetical protein PC129_g23463 [Phytophthora cactorum]|uniref:Uncharacterized protein n=2 Tax=Phytophthora cactorum TaxID=29920 RepID=A0A8T1GUQ0_9STRA|nr:hypothetical protein PC129_g23463 [Phytophthora cactorum]
MPTSPARRVMRRRRSKDVESDFESSTGDTAVSNVTNQQKTVSTEQRTTGREKTVVPQSGLTTEHAEEEESKQEEGASSAKTLELVDVARVLHGLTAMVTGMQPSVVNDRSSEQQGDGKRRDAREVPVARKREVEMSARQSLTQFYRHMSR